MTIRTALGGAILVGATMAITTTVVSSYYQDDTADAMKVWMELGQPGPEHMKMKESVGKWQQTMKHWMGPGTEPVESTSVSEVKSLFDGRYFVENMKGSMMMDGVEVPTEGMGIFGYDRAKKKHFFFWLDSMSTGTMYGEGTENADGDIVYLSEMPDPMSGGTTKMKTVTSRPSASIQEMEMYAQQPDGSWFKNMALTAKKMPARQPAGSR